MRPFEDVLPNSNQRHACPAHDGPLQQVLSDALPAQHFRIDIGDPLGMGTAVFVALLSGCGVGVLWVMRDRFVDHLFTLLNERGWFFF